MFYFIESHYNDFVHISFDSTKLYIFKLVTTSVQKLKNGPLNRGHPKLYYCLSKNYQSFLHQNYHNFAENLTRARPKKLNVCGFLSIFTETINFGNFNPSEMSKTFIFAKKCVSLRSIYYDG